MITKEYALELLENSKKLREDVEKDIEALLTKGLFVNKYLNDPHSTYIFFKKVSGGRFYYFIGFEDEGPYDTRISLPEYRSLFYH